jgi:hypothetical protein
MHNLLSENFKQSNGMPHHRIINRHLLLLLANIQHRFQKTHG